MNCLFIVYAASAVVMIVFDVLWMVMYPRAYRESLFFKNMQSPVDFVVAVVVWAFLLVPVVYACGALVWLEVLK